MSRASRKASAAARTAALLGESNVAAVSAATFGGMTWGGGGQGWDGANYSSARGLVYWPQSDTRRDLPPMPHAEMVRRSRYLDANVGIAGRMNSALARLIAGTGLMPVPKTGDAAWNKERAALFEQRNGTASVFDLGGWWDFYSAQFGSQYCANRDGDIGGILTASQSNLARTSFIESHRIANGRTTDADTQRLFHGVLVDRNNAPVAYRVLGDDDSQADIPAANFWYLGHRTSPGRRRTPPLGHRAITHTLDRTEIYAQLKKGIKNANRIGYYISSQLGTVPTRAPGLSASPAPRAKVTDPVSGKKVQLESVIDNGGELPGLDPGEEIKTLLDTRPHPNTLEFMRELARDYALGADISPEILWDIAALGGSNTRYVMADAQSFVDLGQQNLVDSWLARYYFYDTRKEIAAGRLRECPDPQWWKHVFIPPIRWTVDKGRDGKLYLEQVRSGALTFSRLYGWDGLNSEQELTDWMDEMKMIQQLATDRGLDPEKTLDRIYGRPGTAAPAAAPSAEDIAAAAADATPAKK